MIKRPRHRVVLDTNVIIAALKSKSPQSPTLELLRRWRHREFDLLYCDALREEYVEKLLEKGVTPVRSASFLADLDTLGIRVPLAPEDILPRIPADPDDDVVIACAVVGQATYLVTYDPHFEVLGGECQSVRIVNALELLRKSRKVKDSQ